MELFYTQDAGVMRVSIVGTIQNDDIPVFKDRLLELLEMDFDEVVFDLSLLTFLCSSAIGRLLLFNKKLVDIGRSMCVQGVSTPVMEMMQFIKMDLLFPIKR